MTSGNTYLKARPGDVLAQAKARRRSVRNMHAAKEAVAATGIEAILAEWAERIASMPDDPEPEREEKARRVDALPPFQVDGVHEQVLEAREQVRAWTRAILHRECKPYPLSLLGNSGCGKTHLARLAQATLLDAGVGCQLWTWGKVLEAYREERGDMLRQLEGARVLMLDDIGAEFLGTERALEFSLSKFCEMLEVRSGRWTLTTSNMLLHQIAGLDKRCASRLLRNGGRVCQLDLASDYALAQYMKNKKP